MCGRSWTYSVARFRGMLRVYGHAVAVERERAVTSIGNALVQAKAPRLAGEN